MKNNNIFLKIFNYIWLIFIIIPYFNGLGFIFAGWRVKETKWIDEGIFYMLPFISLSFGFFNMWIVYWALFILGIGILRTLLIINSYSQKLNELNNNKNNTIENYDVKMENSSNYTSNISSISFKTNFTQFNKIKINHASINELTEIKYINNDLAKKIIKLRTENIYIKSKLDLSQILNLNHNQIEEIAPYIDFSIDYQDGYRMLDI